MKAIIMAGGEGVRLRPITGEKPKPMAKILDKPVLEYVVNKLKENGIEDICMTLWYKAEKIEEYFGDGQKFGVRISYSNSDIPLGTAGSVRSCFDFLRGDDAIILSGDAIWDFDLRKIRYAFEDRKPDGLIVTCHHPDPTEYGVVITDGEGNITGFVEKPDWEKVTTNLINTGIYILSNSQIEKIPCGQKWDFGKNVFKDMLREKRKLISYTVQGYWCDIGSPEAYRQCCIDILSGSTDLLPDGPQVKPGVYSYSDIESSVSIVPPVYIGENVKLGKGCRIENAVVGAGSIIGKEAVIKDSVVNDGIIGDESSVCDSVLCDKACIGKKSVIERGSVLGDEAIVGENSKVTMGARIYQNVKIENGETVMKDMEKNPVNIREHLVEAGTVTGKYGEVIDADIVKSWGSGLGGFGTVAIGYTGGELAGLLLSAFELGANSVGCETYVIDAGFESMFSWEMGVIDVKLGVFIRQEENVITVSFFGHGGVPADGEIQRIIANRRSKTESPLKVGRRNTVTGTERGYAAWVMKEAGDGKKLSSMVGVYGGGVENRTLRKIFDDMGVTTEVGNGSPRFTVMKRGFSGRAIDENGREVTWEQLQAAAAWVMVKEKKNIRVALPDNSTLALEDGVLKAGGKTVRDRELLYSQRILTDGVMLEVFLARYLDRDNVTLAELVRELSPVNISVESVKPSESCADAMRKLTASLSAEFACEIGEGLTVNGDEVRANVYPSPDGGRILIRAEGKTSDSAASLTEKIKRAISAEK